MARHPRIPEVVSDPAIMSGRPCLSGTRVPVDTVLRLMGQGRSRDAILSDYPQLTSEDLVAVLAYAADAVAARAVAAE